MLKQYIKLFVLPFFRTIGIAGYLHEKFSFPHVNNVNDRLSNRQPSVGEPFRLSGRFVKQEQWKRLRAKRKLVPGSKHPARRRESMGISSRKHFEIVCEKSGKSSCIFGQKMVRNAVHRAFFNNVNDVSTRFPSK